MLLVPGCRFPAMIRDGFSWLSLPPRTVFLYFSKTRPTYAALVYGMAAAGLAFRRRLRLGAALDDQLGKQIDRLIDGQAIGEVDGSPSGGILFVHGRAF